jgi:hypothetical protein
MALNDYTSYSIRAFLNSPDCPLDTDVKMTMRKVIRKRAIIQIHKLKNKQLYEN